MRTFQKKVLDDAKRIFGYRLSRTRRAIENVFGICFSQFHVLRKPIIDDEKNVIFITKVVVSLHNYFIKETRSISGPVDKEMIGDQNSWESFLAFRQADSNNSTKTEKQIREMLVDYFVADEKVSVNKLTLDVMVASVRIQVNLRFNLSFIYIHTNIIHISMKSLPIYEESVLFSFIL